MVNNGQASLLSRYSQCRVLTLATRLLAQMERGQLADLTRHQDKFLPAGYSGLQAPLPTLPTLACTQLEFNLQVWQPRDWLMPFIERWFSKCWQGRLAKPGFGFLFVAVPAQVALQRDEQGWSLELRSLNAIGQHQTLTSEHLTFASLLRTH